MKMPTVSYKRHRFPGEIIGHAVWLYFRFALSFRDVEELLAERGIIVTYETIRQCGQKFGWVYADGVRRRLPRPGEKWHLDEVFLTINGRRQYLWRAVEQHGMVLEIRSRGGATKMLPPAFSNRCCRPAHMSRAW